MPPTTNRMPNDSVRTSQYVNSKKEAMAGSLLFGGNLALRNPKMGLRGLQQIKGIGAKSEV